MAVAEHGDALDFDLFDRWRVRLADVPSTIGWGAVALFLRHLPYDTALMRELHPSTAWTVAEHRLADLVDILVAAFGGGSGPMERPGSGARPKRFSTARGVSSGDMAAEMEDFKRKGAGRA